MSTKCGDCRLRRLIAVPGPGLFLLIALVIIFGVSCGSDDGGSSGGELQISITYPAAQTYTLSAPAADIVIGGTVSESPFGKVEGTVCNCAGFGCLIDPQCSTMYFPRVDVTILNSTTGQTVDARLDYNSSVQIETIYSWHATVPLGPGTNSLVANAYDDMGYAGSDSITIINP